MTSRFPITGDIISDCNQEAAQVYAFSAAGRIKSKTFRNPGRRIPTRSTQSTEVISDCRTFANVAISRVTTVVFHMAWMNVQSYFQAIARKSC